MDKTGQRYTEPVLLEMKDISKSFPGVKALDQVSLHLAEAEVLALLGENGAGKSTLIKVLGGAYQADAGEVLIDGKSQGIHTPSEAWDAGISIIYQEFNLIPGLSVRENIYLGRELTKRGFIDEVHERDLTRQLFHRIGLELDPDILCKDLSVAQQQTVEIAKALSFDARIIVMDEPSATLTTREVDVLFKIIHDLKTQGISVIYISHRLNEVHQIADRVLVLRDGSVVGEESVPQVTRDKLIEMMVGRPMDAEFPPHEPRTGKIKLRVEGLCLGDEVQDVSFIARQGEILGFAGLVGAGRTETMRLLFGADRPDSGRILIDEHEVSIRDPREAISRGICLLSEDRKAEGLILGMSSRENFALPTLKRLTKGLFVDQHREAERFEDYKNNLNIKLTDPEAPVLNLSGGNQQKVVLAKWLEANADIVIFDEPTRGIDVGAKYEIYLLIKNLAEEGKCIIIVSSELPELLGLCDRIIVMHEGVIKGEILEPASYSQEDILDMAIS